MVAEPEPGARQPARTQSLYRKYRPETFNTQELVGQDHVSRTLRNAILQGRVSHAYLFCGPRGTGKTTTARLLAKAVNCLDPDPENRPCNACTACVAINQGRTTDVVEIDAASNRGIEDIRDLREQVKYAPTQLQHKFYIIDEAHRLTRDAFNAFLKTLEEPPPNTTFVLATTDPDELLETVASRCQRFDFHRIPVEKMVQRVRDVCDAEGIEIDDDALAIVVRHSTGSLRDALSLIDMLATATGRDGEGGIDADLTRRMLGLSQDERTLHLIEAIADQDLAAGLRTINDVLDSGQDMRAFGRQVIAALRLLMLCRAGADPAEADDDLRQLAGRFEIPDLLHINRQFSETDFAIRNGGFPQLPLELALVASIVGEPSAGQAAEQPGDYQARRSNPARQPEPRNTQPDQPSPDRLSNMAPSAAPRSRSSSSQPAKAEKKPTPITSQKAKPEPSPEPQPERALEPSGDVSTDAVIERWAEIRTEVKALDRKTEALLASTDPGGQVDGALVLLASYPFHAGKLNETKTKAIIEEAVERVMGVPISINTMLREEFQATTNARPQPAAPARDPLPAQSTQPQARERKQTNDGDDEMVEPEDDESEQNFQRLKVMFDAEEIDLEDLPDLK